MVYFPTEVDFYSNKSSQCLADLDRSWTTVLDVLTVWLGSTVLEELQNLVQPVQKGKHLKQDQPAPPTIAHMVRQY